MGGAQSGLAFDVVKKEEALEENRVSEIVRKNLQKRNFPVSESDLELHQEFIRKNFKTNFWY